MGILVLFVAFALPSLFGPLDKSRLRSGARDVQAALGKARSLAIREGQVLEFRYEIDGSRWSIAHRDPVPQAMAAASITSSGLRAEDKSADNRSPAGGTRRQLVREGRLPDGTTFRPTNGVTTDDQRESPNRSPGVRWSEAIPFHPNGRSEDTELQIGGRREFVIAIAVRGLTSAVSFSEPFRRRSSNSEIITDGTSGDRSVRGRR